VANVHNLEKIIQKRTKSVIYLILWDFILLFSKSKYLKLSHIDLAFPMDVKMPQFAFNILHLMPLAKKLLFASISNKSLISKHPLAPTKFWYQNYYKVHSSLGIHIAFWF
jgi:hypothetical protein